MSEWNPVDELPPRQYKNVSADVVVRKRNGKEMVAYYLFPRQKWIAKESGEEIPRGKIFGWRCKGGTINRREKREDYVPA